MLARNRRFDPKADLYSLSFTFAEVGTHHLQYLGA